METLNEETIKERIKKRVATIVKGDPETIEDSAKFSDVGIDSADMITIIYDLETEFDVLISDEEVGGISTIQDACTLINNKVNNR